jgi:nicotinamidase-related amidase
MDAVSFCTGEGFMGAHFRSLKWDRVLIDICTQRDFLEAGGILQVVNREPLMPALREVFRFARSGGLPVVSFVESHRPSEPLSGFPLHCIDGTHGQEKLPWSLLAPWTIVETDNYLSLPPDLVSDHRQIIFRKRTKDVLSNPKADRFLTHATADAFILFGVGLERAIRSLALGLLARSKPVTVITDACGYWSSADGDLSLRQLAAKGVKLVTVEQFVNEPPPKRVRPFQRLVVDRHNPTTAPTRGRHRTDVGRG